MVFSWAFNQGAMRAKLDELEAADWGEHDMPVAADHALHAAGQRCGYCGEMITADEPARRAGDDTWVHDGCHKPRPLNR